MKLLIEALDLAAALEEAVRSLRRGDTFLPVRVLVPSHLLGVRLTREVFREKGHVGLHFVLPEELAWWLVAPRDRAGGRRPVPEYADLAMVLAATAEAAVGEGVPDYLRRAVATRGFAPAALDTLLDLDAAGIGPDDLDRYAPSSPDPDKVRLLARVQRGRTERLEAARLLPRAELLRLAARALPDRELGGVVVCHVADPSPALAELLQALAATQPFAWVRRPLHPGTAPRRAAREGALVRGLGLEAPREGGLGRQPGVEPAPAAEPAGDSALSRLQARLLAEVQPAPAPHGSRGHATDAPRALDPSLRVLACPGESLEAVEIARLIVEAAGEGLRFDEIAVLTPRSGAYAAGLDAAFERAGIDAFFVEGTPRVDPAARALGLLLDLLDRDLDRARVMEFLTTAQVPWEDLLGEDGEISAARWDRLSAEAGIVGGLDAWRRGIERAAQRAGERAERDERPPEEDRDLRLLDSLRRLIERLASDLAAFPERGSWADFLHATLRLLEGWIRNGERVRDRLERVLGPLAVHAPDPQRAEFLARVAELLASQTYREGELGDPRVFVGSIESARGFRFRMVVVPGLAERRFPTVVRPDPLLLDEERRALGENLRTSEDGHERDRLLFEEAARSAGERLVLSYPRVDNAGKELVPSSFLLRAVEAATGGRVAAAHLLSLAAAGETGLGRPWPNDPGRSLDRLERDLGLVASGRRGAARHLLEDAPHFARSRAADRSQWERTATAWDGIVDPIAAAPVLERLVVDGRSVSASWLQDFAACPYRHLLKRGLWLRPWPEPGRAYQPDPKQRGSLYHDVLQRLFAGLREAGLLPLTPERLPLARARVAGVIDAVLDEAAAEGLVVHRRLLDPLAVEMRRDLDELLRREAGEGAGFVPTDFERTFEGVPFAFGDAGQMALNGKLDRIDVATGPARVRVVDYKTGGFFWEEGQELDGGREFQLVAYNLAAARLYPGHTVTEAIYDYATEKGGFKRKRCPDTAEKREALRTILGTLDGLARQGVFAPSADSCKFCDFQELCGAEPLRTARALRKQADPRLEAFRRLREMP